MGDILIQLSGEYDIGRQSELEALLAQADGGATIVIDMSEVSYVDSTALSCLIRMHKRVSRDGYGAIRIVGARPNIRRVFSVTKLDGLFEMEDATSESLPPA